MNLGSVATKDILLKILREQCGAFLASEGMGDSFFNLIREESYGLLSECSLPTRKDERYRYTPLVEKLTPLFTEGMPLAKPADTLLRLPALLEGIRGYALTLCNGGLIRGAYGQRALPFDVYALGEGYERYPQYFEAYFNQQARLQGDPWVLLNGTLFGGGCFVYVPDDTVLEKPIILYHHIDTYTPASLYPRIFFVLGKRSRATVVEMSTTLPLAPPVFLNGVTEIVLEEESDFTYYPLRIGDSPTHQLRYTYVQQAKGSDFGQYLIVVPMNDPLVRDETTVRLGAAQARARLHGIYRGDGVQHLALHTAVHHDGPHTTTIQDYRGVGQGVSTTLFDGYIHIAPQSEKAVATQQHRGWIGSDGAAIHARPQLAIEADDVQCSHGTTTVRADPAVLSYMQSRGIAQDQAYQMLLGAFFEEKIEAIPDEAVRRVIRRVLENRLF